MDGDSPQIRLWLRHNSGLILRILLTIGLGFVLAFLAATMARSPSPAPRGTSLTSIAAPVAYPDGRPSARYRLEAKDQGVVLRHGSGPAGCDRLGARDIWVWEHGGTYYMHYDGAGEKGWLACLATSANLTDWALHGPALDFGAPGSSDSASASYGVTYLQDSLWHMFYLGTPHTSPPPDRVPAFPYLTMKAESRTPVGPWKKRYDIIPFRPKPGTYYSATASPGFIVKEGRGYTMFYSASTDAPIMRTLGIARTNDLNDSWTIDPKPILPPAEQVENTSLFQDESTGTWFLFTNHVGLKNGLEYTDAVWVYWTKDLDRWDPRHKAVVLDASNCSWSKEIIGLPSVVKAGERLAIFYDGYAGATLPQGPASHMHRDIGLAWLPLPLNVSTAR